MFDKDEELTKKVNIYQEVAKENPNVDVGMLMMNALSTENQNQVSTNAKRWAYLVSLSAPPFGLLWAAKYYYFSDEEDAKQVAIICVILTVAAVVVFYIGYKLFFGAANVTPQQIEQIKPSDIQQILQ